MQVCPIVNKNGTPEPYCLKGELLLIIELLLLIHHHIVYNNFTRAVRPLVGKGEGETCPAGLGRGKHSWGGWLGKVRL